MAASKKGHDAVEAEIDGLGLARAGQRVVHPKFRGGVIERFFVYDSGLITVLVSFDIHGPKWLDPKFASLKAE